MVWIGGPSANLLNYLYDQAKIGLLLPRATIQGTKITKERSMNNFQVCFRQNNTWTSTEKKIGSSTIMSHMSQTHNVPGLWTYKLLRLPFITCCTVRVVAFSKNRAQFIHKTKRHDCEQLLKKIDGLIKSGNSRNNAHSSHGPGA